MVRKYYIDLPEAVWDMFDAYSKYASTFCKHQLPNRPYQAVIIAAAIKHLALSTQQLYAADLSEALIKRISKNSNTKNRVSAVLKDYLMRKAKHDKS